VAECFIDGGIDFFLGNILVLPVNAGEVLAHCLANLTPTWEGRCIFCNRNRPNAHFLFVAQLPAQETFDGEPLVGGHIFNGMNHGRTCCMFLILDYRRRVVTSILLVLALSELPELGQFSTSASPDVRLQSPFILQIAFTFLRLSIGSISK